VQALKPTPMPCLTLLASWRSKRNHVGGETSDDLSARSSLARIGELVAWIE